MQWFESERVTTVYISDRIKFTFWIEDPIEVSYDVRYVPCVLICLSLSLCFVPTRTASLQSTPERAKNVPATHLPSSSFFNDFTGAHTLLTFTPIKAPQKYRPLIIIVGATLGIYKHFMK